MHLRSLISTIALLLLGLGSTPARAGTVVIAHDAFPAQRIERSELLRIYQGKVSRFEGTRITLATLQGGPAHERFARDYLGRTPQQFMNYWRKMVFSGKGQLPRSFATDAQLVAYVAATPGAIGYIDEATPHRGVRVLSIE